MSTTTVARLGDGGAGAACATCGATIGGVILFGYSMGGSVSLVAADGFAPDALILVAPFWRFAWPIALALPIAKHVYRQVRPFRNVDFQDPQVRAFLASFLPDIDIDDPTVRQNLSNQLVLPTGVLDTLRRLGQQAVRAAPRLTTSALVLQGRSDGTVAPAATRHLAMRLGGPISYVEIGGGHEGIRLAGPTAEGYVAAVLNWIQRNPDLNLDV